MIRYLWFDLGYTLVKTNREEAYQKALERMGVYRGKEEIAIAYHRSDKLFMREYPGCWARTAARFCLGTWGRSTTICGYRCRSMRCCKLTGILPGSARCNGRLTTEPSGRCSICEAWATVSD